MTPATRRGRPVRGDARATAQIKAAVSPAEKAYLEAAAEAADLDLAELLRQGAFDLAARLAASRADHDR